MVKEGAIRSSVNDDSLNDEEEDLFDELGLKEEAEEDYELKTTRLTT